MKMGISKKVILLFILLLTTLGVALGFYFLKHQKETLLLEFDERAKALLSSLAISTEYPVLIGNEKALDKIGEGILKQKDVVFCGIRNREGKALFQGGSKSGKYSREYTSPILTKVIKESADEELILGFREKETEEIGRIYLVLSLASLTKKLNEVKKTIGILVTVGIVLASMFITLLVRFILSRPIDELIRGIEKISGGDLNYKVPLKTKDEIGLLTNSFNKMTEDLQKTTVSRDYVDNIIKSMIDSLIVFSPGGKIHTVNQATLDLLGYKKEELTGKDSSILFPEGKRILLKEIKQELITWGQLRGYEINYKAKDGRKIPVLRSRSVMKDAGGDITNIVCVAKDITERKQAEERILRQGAVLNAINKVFKEALTSETEEELARTCLTVAEDLTGSKFGFIGEVNENKRCDVIALSNPGWDACEIPKSDSVVMIKNMEIRGIWGKVIKDEKSLIVNDPASYPDRAGTPKDHPRLTSFMGVPLKHAGKTMGIISLANKESGYDFAEQEAVETLSVGIVEALMRKRAELKLKQTLVDLAHSNAELESFSYSVSHDLRAPLRSMNGFSQALLEDYADKLDAQAKDYLKRVRAASQRMAELIDDLLKLSRVTRSQIKRERVDLSALANTIVAELQKRQPKRQVEFIIQEMLIANGDTQLLRLALENLLGNAWKFTGKQPSARIEFGVTQHRGRPAYFVRDDGVGFDMSYAQKLFVPFQRLHSATEFPGTGIGLATIKRIIHRHGGSVWAEGVVEQGATFYFTL